MTRADKILVELQKLIQFWEGKMFEIRPYILSQYQSGKLEGEEIVVNDVKLLRRRIMRQLNAKEKETRENEKRNKK